MELRSLRMGGVTDPKLHALPDVYYHVNSRSSVTKGVRINPQKLGSAWAQPPCSRGVGDPLKYTSPYVGYTAEFGRSRSNASAIKDIPLKKFDPCCPGFRGHSRSWGPTANDPWTYSYRFRDKRWFQSKIANFSHTRVFCSPLKGFPLKFGIGARGQKLEWWGYTGPRKTFDDVISHLDTIHERDGRTPATAMTVLLICLCTASRGKKWFFFVYSNQVRSLHEIDV